VNYASIPEPSSGAARHLLPEGEGTRACSTCWMAVTGWSGWGKG